MRLGQQGQMLKVGPASLDAAPEKARVKNHFSALARIYHEKNYERPIARRQYPDILLRHERILEMVDGERGHALDVGCGSGRLLADLHLRGFRVYGTDLSPAMVEASRSLARERAIAPLPRLARGDIEHLAFRNDSFDLVIAAGVLEYLSGDGRALAEVHRVLRRGGVAILSVRNRINLSKPLVLARAVLGATIGRLARRAAPTARPHGETLPVRRHVPWHFRRQLAGQGFVIEDRAFYRFDVCPALCRRWLPRLCIGLGLRLERFARSPLGYWAAGYLIKVRKG